MTDSVECVQVVVRCRPLNQKEIDGRCKKILAVNESSGEIIIGNNDSRNNKQSTLQISSKMYTFDKAFGENSTQEVIYEETAKGIVNSVMDGYNGTIFAYGQTGTGKTYTMVGIHNDEIRKGIIPRTFKHIFRKCEINNKKSENILVRCSFIEIYNDSIKDLLNTNTKVCGNLELREHPEKGVYVKDLSYCEVKTEYELEKYFEFGNNFRHVSETAMNRDSSRSHCIFTIIIESIIEENIRVGKLHLVDLAGSERQTKTHAKGMRFTEAININLSLSALGNVINLLSVKNKNKNKNKNNHIPYRDSKLTRILQDSLGGNSKTIMIANICSSDYNSDETMSTLRFANRAKYIKNKPHINQDAKDKLLEEYRQQIEELRKRLAYGNFDQELGQEIIPKIISKAKECEMHKLQEKYEKEKKEWEKQAKDYLTKKIKTEKKLKFIQEEILLKKQIKKENIKKKLLDIEKKLVDGEKMMNCAQKQEEELMSKRTLLAEIKSKEETLRRDYQQKHQKHLLLKEKYNSHSEELKDKKNQLVKLYEKYKTLSHNIENLQSSFQSKREEYLNIIRILNRKILLKNTIIEYFIHPQRIQKLYESGRIVLEDNDNEIDNKIYKIKPLDLQKLNNTIRRPISCKQRVNSNNDMNSKVKRIKPVTEWNRIQCVLLQNENPRYRYKDIVQLQLDMPQRTTQDYHHVYDECMNE